MKYKALHVFSRVYCNSQGYAYFEVGFDWYAKRRVGQYSPFDTSIAFTKRRGKSTVVNKYPQYLKHEIHFAIYELLVSGKATFYEIDRDENIRYELRYFDLLSYRATFFEIATVCRDADPQRMADIFNCHHHELRSRHYIDTSAANPNNEIVMLSDAYCDQKYSYPNVSAKIRGKRVKGWKVGNTDTWMLNFIAPVHKQISMTRNCGKCDAEIDFNKQFVICEKCRLELAT